VARAAIDIVIFLSMFPIHNSPIAIRRGVATSARTHPVDRHPAWNKTAREKVLPVRQSHGAIMNEPNGDPAFEVRRLKSAPGWYVRVAWSHGKRDHIPGFVSQQEALRWIETKARAWVSEQTRVSFRGIAA
jgi:hypothetical protein